MKVISRDIDEAEVIASWLKAETDSVRFSKLISKALHKTNLGETLISRPNLKNSEENKARKRIIKIARRNALKKFPWQYVKWYKIEIENKHELGTLYTPFGDTWLSFTYGERTLAKAADFINMLPSTHDPIIHALGVQKRLQQGQPVEPPILVTAAEDFSR